MLRQFLGVCYLYNYKFFPIFTPNIFVVFPFGAGVAAGLVLAGVFMLLFRVFRRRTGTLRRGGIRIIEDPRRMLHAYEHERVEPEHVPRVERARVQRPPRPGTLYLDAHENFEQVPLE